MPQAMQVQCINKTNRHSAHERIANVGGSIPTRWEMTEQQAIAAIDAGVASFYVNVGGRSIRVVIARSAAGNRYLKTENDGEQPNNLLSLPECP